MIAVFKPSELSGRILAPASKSIAHRYLICAALSGHCCELMDVDYSEDILASIDCMKALGVDVRMEANTVLIDPQGFMKTVREPLDCRESGSTLRFFMPLALCMGREITFIGSDRLLERPLSVFEDLCREKDFTIRRDSRSITVCGKLKCGDYRIRGDVSSQFITGLILALVYLGGESTIEIVPPFESRPYVDLTLSALCTFGAKVAYEGANKIVIHPSSMHAQKLRIEGDYSNAAFLEAFNRLGSRIEIGNLSPSSLQGDRVFADYFDRLEEETPILDLSDCPDLGPVLFALAAMKNGAVFIGTDRLKDKESDRGAAMHEELLKLGGGMIFGENSITVPRQRLRYRGIRLNGHNDHRIVMALSVILSKLGGELQGVEAVKKSYPRFFEDLKELKSEVSLL